jgi:N-acyl-D-amino-acid deacylase
VTAEPRFDFVFRGGSLLDGSGAAPVAADVGIIDDRIAQIGDLSRSASGAYFDAGGLRIVPGFIDIHTHSDISVTYDPGQGSYIAMGVTTQVVGNCGLAMGHTSSAGVFEFERRWLAPHGARIRWNSYAEFLNQIDGNGTATNLVPLSGHGTLRKRVMGIEDRRPTSDELLGMQRELQSAMEAGCFGFSSGLEYPPSAYADEDELTELCRVLGQYGGFYATHLRNEGDTLVEAVQEALNVSQRAGVALQLSHHKAEGPANWGKTATTLQMMEAARVRGHDVQTDQYPYPAFMTALSIQVLPKWALAGAVEETAEKLRDPSLRARVAADMRANHPDWDDVSPGSFWKDLQIGVCHGRPETQGRSILELAREAGMLPIDYVLDLLTEVEGYVSAVNFAIGEEDIARVMQYPWTSIGSDGVGTHPEGTGGADKIHPRAYGTFPRVLGRYVRELGVLTEAQAIRKMTALPADRLGLKDRGRLAPGCFADITVYDPAVIEDCATFSNPHQYPRGVCLVMVNGRVALESGRPNGERHGRVLRKNQSFIRG